MIHTITDHGRTYRIEAPSDEHIGEPLKKGRPYEQKLLRCIYDLGLSGTAVDVGAHVGNHSLYLAAVCRLKVLAFEPDQDSYRSLVDNFEKNRKDLQVQAFPVGLGSRFHTADWVAPMTLEEAPAGDVEVHAFDSLAHPDDISVVKVDVEGYESEVLAGMTGMLASAKPHLFTEVHTSRDVAEQAMVVGPLGYALDHFIHMGSRYAHWRMQ